jgi:hypothetical protein
MAQVPVSMQVTIYPRDKSVKPYPATIVGYAWITGLEVGGGPMPGGGGDPAHPDQGLPGHGSTPGTPTHPIVLPPVEQPPPVEESGVGITITVKAAPPSGGWGLNLDEGWYYSPGTGQAGPKRR